MKTLIALTILVTAAAMALWKRWWDMVEPRDVNPLDREEP